MTEASTDIVSIPIAAIEVLNPRFRNRRIFEELVASIRAVGLKKPITVTQKTSGDGYELVCGQGRMEAFVALGQKEIPAVVIEASREDCYVMSLIENLARQNHSPLELIREVGAMRERGYDSVQIAAKIGFSPEYAFSICFLLDRGEERLLDAVERGVIPHTIAVEIARANDAGVQRALTEAYESKALPGKQVLAIRRIVEERNKIGKSVKSIGHPQKSTKTTAAALVRSYRREIDRQKLIVKKAELAQGRLIFIVNALRRLLEEEHFVILLRAEAIGTLPQPLAERIGIKEA
ncbi:plasmid partitioning protein RepB C-terminal domain-containing protein [Methylobacterium radiodurans]|uniref:Chromosome partitioning protein ParB n=1 Tax=Methylobacterium radiodurans TaxID=2202828 RepID=A0A2U8VQQ7_9HYPH|nr:plasmid partitioning protein RepB C-terminal domain-containing protein [Methylobacterium radiodurans]AWN35965.1 chromosome partitioning protein ParB [Methylobacterium radiodurans]